MFPTWSDWSISYTHQGASKKRRKAIFRSLVFLTLFSGAVRLGLSGKNWTSIKPVLRRHIKKVLLVSAGSIQKIGETL